MIGRGTSSRARGDTLEDVCEAPNPDSMPDEVGVP
jgi:hypothetical protein